MCRRADHPQLPESKGGAVKDMAHAAQDVARDQTSLQCLIQDAVEEVLPICKPCCRSMPNCLCDDDWAKEYNERHDPRDPRYDQRWNRDNNALFLHGGMEPSVLPSLERASSSLE